MSAPADANGSTFVRAQRYIGEHVTSALERLDPHSVARAVQLLLVAGQVVV